MYVAASCLDITGSFVNGQKVPPCQAGPSLINLVGPFLSFRCQVPVSGAGVLSNIHTPFSTTSPISFLPIILCILPLLLQLSAWQGQESLPPCSHLRSRCLEQSHTSRCSLSIFRINELSNGRKCTRIRTMEEIAMSPIR